MNLGGYTATGPREANEDNYFVRGFPSGVTFPNGIKAFALVSDGMGGYQGGDVASTTAVQQSENYLQQLFEMAGQAPIDLDAHIALNEIVERAHAAILSEAEHAGRSMGATFVGAFISESHAWIGHVGDSRAYLIRDGSAVQLTEDHSQVGRMLARGLITEEEAQNHPERNKIEQALGFTVNETTIDEQDLLPNDAILLCSDGVYTVLGNSKLAALVQSEKDASRAAERVVKAALSAGTDDNSTAVVVFLSQNTGRRRTNTLSERDQQRTVSMRHQGSNVRNAKRGQVAHSGVGYTASSLGTARSSNSRPLKSIVIPAIAALLLIGVLVAVGLRACQANQGGGTAVPTNQSSQQTESHSVEVSSESVPVSAGSSNETSSKVQTQTASGSSQTLQSPKTVYYVDMYEQVREFSKDNGLQSPNLIILQGKSVASGSGAKIDDTGQEFIYLSDSYVDDLLGDVRLYESGSRSFTSSFSQLFEPNSYLRTVEAISSFFNSAGYGIDQEVTHLLISAETAASSASQATSEVSASTTNNNLESQESSQSATTNQVSKFDGAQGSDSVLEGTQEGLLNESVE